MNTVILKQSEKSFSFIIPLLFIAPLGGIASLPRIALNDQLLRAYLVVIALLSIWYGVLLFRSKFDGSLFRVTLNIARPHYVQALIQISIFWYWSWYWELIAHNSLLIISQLLFAYAFEALLNWSKAKIWRLGFGPFPIVLSINLFLCFKDHWFIVQFLVIALGFLLKETITWERNGRRKHIFNPSAITLFLFSLGLILTDTTDLTWAEEIAIRLNDPDYIYLYIFAVGLIVQFLFDVTLVTLAAAATLYVLNLIYTQLTGIYWFLDAGIPIAVFLGLHLLVTDPATSPRSNLGRCVFGCLYGLGVFFLYGMLEIFGEPRFYDKLLCVPLLNLLVRFMDHLEFPKFISSIALIDWGRRRSPKQVNVLFMLLWISFFTVMYNSGFIGEQHAGQSIAFWQNACQEGKRNACSNLKSIYRDNCYSGKAVQCEYLGDLYRQGGFSDANDLNMIYAFAFGCEQGSAISCDNFVRQLKLGDQERLTTDCDANGRSLSCYVLAAGFIQEAKMKSNTEKVFHYFAKGCELGFALSCNLTGDMHLYGVGTIKDYEQARASYQLACNQNIGQSCLSISNLFELGMGVDISKERAEWYRRKACAVGLKKACLDEPFGNRAIAQIRNYFKAAWN
ncbi:MAG: tetratricopeptide repeat protein [Gammaproteobacteria bacterium]